jgi:nucleoside phosphorylase
MKVKIVVFTPIDLEFASVAKYLTDSKPIFVDDALYQQGYFKGKHHEYDILVCETGAKVANMAVAAERAISFFQPSLSFLVGIAGTIKDALIGDIVVGTKAYGYESGKESDQGYVSRPEVQPFSTHLLSQARNQSRIQTWKQRADKSAQESNVYFGAIASGDILMANTDNPTFQRLKLHFNDAIAIEMEANGFAKALEGKRDVHGLVIRGISDLCKDKSLTDQKGNQPLAADRAAAFFYELLWAMDCTSFIKTNNMQINDIVHGVYAHLFPAVINELGKDFKNTANNDSRVLWEKVLPLVKKEVEKLAKDPDNTDRQAAVRTALADALEENNGIKEEIEVLLGKLQGQSTGQTISVVNSKNVIAGGTVTVGGDFRLGDG